MGNHEDWTETVERLLEREDVMATVTNFLYNNYPEEFNND